MKIDDNIIQMTARTAASVPTPSAGIVYQFLDTATNHYSQKDDTGTVTDLGAAGGGGGTVAISGGGTGETTQQAASLALTNYGMMVTVQHNLLQF